MVKSTIMDMPNEAKMPYIEARIARFNVLRDGVPQKNASAMIKHTNHPTTPMKVPDFLKKTSPAKITIIGTIAKIKYIA
jgi:hypothetical protein